MSKVLAFLLIVLSCMGRAAVAADELPTVDRTAILLDLVNGTANDRRAIYERLSKSRSADLVPALEAYRGGLLGVHDGRPVIYAKAQELAGRGEVHPVVDAITREQLRDVDGHPVYAADLGSVVMAPRAERKIIASLIAKLSMFDADLARRKQAIVEAGQRADADLLESLTSQLDSDHNSPLQYEIRAAVAYISLVHGDRPAKLLAAETLEELAPLGAADRLTEAYNVAVADDDVELSAAIASALNSVRRYQRVVDAVHNSFAGLSLASILILMGLGLAIIFGLMRVINMAHGEFMMIGAFATYVAASLFATYLPPWTFNYYWFAAIPMAFAAAAVLGWICEVTLIRRLYGRPLDSLLATWGVSLILIQIVRLRFGDTIALTPPSWFEGGWEVAAGLVLPWNRLFIIGYCVACVLLVYFVIYKTRFGLLLRATTQNREMATALGVNARRVDAIAFAFGTGLAGLAGCAVVLFDKLNPQMGQGYVVDSFLVVVVGGIGRLEGVIAAGCGMGFLTKYLEPWLQSVYGKVALLVLIVCFLQRWPAGLFADRGRLADDQ